MKMNDIDISFVNFFVISSNVSSTVRHNKIDHAFNNKVIKFDNLFLGVEIRTDGMKILKYKKILKCVSWPDKKRS